MLEPYNLNVRGGAVATSRAENEVNEEYFTLLLWFKTMSKIHYQKLEKGDIVGGIEVLGYSHTDSGKNRWLNILCSCGTEFKAAAWRVKKRHTKSCGCLLVYNCVARNVGTPYKIRCERANKGWETRRRNNEMAN